jgi:hypothetical protein
VSLIAADGLAQEGPDMDDLSGETVAGEQLLHSGHAQKVPMVVIDWAQDMLVNFLHLKKPDAKRAASYTANLDFLFHQIIEVAPKQRPHDQMPREDALNIEPWVLDTANQVIAQPSGVMPASRSRPAFQIRPLRSHSSPRRNKHNNDGLPVNDRLGTAQPKVPA